MFRFIVYLFFLLSVNTLNASSSVESNTGVQCNMLNVKNFYLEPSCFAMDSLAPMIKIRTSTPEICQSQCCNYHEGSCDMFYWDRKEVQSRLSCDDDRFLCDDWSCRSGRCECDDTGCPDGVRPSQGKCFGDNGQWYGVGQRYLPFGDPDKCKICTCGNDSRPLYCIAPLCHHKSGDMCEIQPSHICCNCLRNLHLNETSSSDDYLSSSKRLIVSGVFVLMVIIILLFFSKSVRSPSSRSAARSSVPRRGLRWLMFSGNQPRGNSWQGRYSSNTDSICFFDENGLPIESADFPPPYSAVKFPPPSPSPPSYRSSIGSGLNETDEPLPGFELLCTDDPTPDPPTPPPERSSPSPHDVESSS